MCVVVVGVVVVVVVVVIVVVDVVVVVVVVVVVEKVLTGFEQVNLCSGIWIQRIKLQTYIQLA